MFGSFIIVYLFLGGCGSGMLLVSSVWSLLFHHRSERTRRETAAFRAFRNRCFVVGLVVVAIGAICLLADLGRPDRFLLLFLRPNATYLTFGTFVLAGLMVVGVFLSFADCLYVPWVTSRMKVIAEVLCAFFSVAVMAYTGLFLQGLYAVAFWDTWLVPVLFVLSAASMGMSGCLLAGTLLRDSWLIEDDFEHVHRIHLVILVAEALALAALLLVSLGGRGEAPASASMLLSGSLLPWFAFGVLVCGLAVPIASEAAIACSRRIRPLPLADALCIFGGFALRFCIVSAGLH